MFNDDHPLTQRELTQTIGGFLGAMAFANFIRYWGIQIKPYIFGWMVLLGAIPITWLLIVAMYVNSAPADGGDPEWISGLAMWLGALWILVAIAGVVCIWVDWHGQIMMRQAQYQQALVDQQDAEDMAVIQDGINKVRYDHAVARATGQAVADALRDQRPPEEPTGPSQRPSAPTPPPAPASPMGSNAPTLWVPTFHGPRKELQRRETTLGGIWMNDHRGVDPDDL
jgi:hypothetical protein